MRIATIVGARPQFIKIAAVSRALSAARCEEISIHTGQHYDAELSDVFFGQLDIRQPDFNLATGSGLHGAQTARMLAGLEPILASCRPDRVVVIGDTNSTLAGALVAAKLCLPLAHIEAGLRSHNRAMPEEINRVCADHLADRLYYSTRAARENLRREGLLHLGRDLGDVTLDAVRLFSAIQPGPELAALPALEPPYVLVTLHRAETTDDPQLLAAIWRRLLEIEWPVLFPIHPRTRAAIQIAGLAPGPRLHLVAPVGYAAMLRLLRDASLLITDSGGLQKEACFLETPCLTMRRETEWVETVDSGWNRLYDLDTRPPVDVRTEAARRGARIEEYGDGHAAERIVADIMK